MLMLLFLCIQLHETNKPQVSKDEMIITNHILSFKHSPPGEEMDVFVYSGLGAACVSKVFITFVHSPIRIW